MSLNNGFVNSTIVSNHKKDVDLDALNLLASGAIDEFCLCTYKNENKHHHFIYDTQDMIALAQLQAGMSFENVIDLLSCVVKMIRSMQEHNLVLDNLKNAKAYIFRDDGGYRFVYLPLTHKPHMTVRDFLLKLLSVIHHKDVRLNLFIKELKKKKENAQAMSYLSAFVASYTSPDDIRDYAAEESATTLLGMAQNHPLAVQESDEGETTVLSRMAYQETPVSPDEEGTTLLSQAGYASDEGETTVLSQMVYQETPVSPDEEGTTLLSQAGYASDEGETSVLSQMGTDDVIQTSGYRTTAFFQDASGEYETTVLTSQPVLPQQPLHREINSEYTLCLVRNLNSERISIDVTPFTIGKDSANMDFVLNNDSVSRHHATVICENGEYFIMDNHSTNGTMVEGIRLQPEEKCEIGNGYIISMGNESFQAYIERR